MKRKPIFFGLFFVLIGLILFSTLSANSTNSSFISGDDCLEAHHWTYVMITPQLDYDGPVSPNRSLTYSIAYEIITNGMIFAAESEIIFENSSLILTSGDEIQEKSEMNADEFSPTWALTANATGNYTFTIESTITVNYQKAHPRYVATYLYTHQVTHQIANISSNLPLPTLVGAEVINPPNAFVLNFTKNIGQIFGFFSFLSVYLVIRFGMPDRRSSLQKKLNLSISQMNEWHCNLGYMATASIALHFLILSQTKNWGLYFQWFEFYPQFLGLREDFSSLFIGLDLATWAGTLFLVSTIAGVFFKQIARKWNYRVAIAFQQLSYIALILAVIHSILNGSWTSEILPIAGILIILVLDILYSRIAVTLKRKQKRDRQKEQKMEQVQPTTERAE